MVKSVIYEPQNHFLVQDKHSISCKINFKPYFYDIKKEINVLNFSCFLKHYADFFLPLFISSYYLGTQYKTFLLKHSFKKMCYKKDTSTGVRSGQAIFAWRLKVQSLKTWFTEATSLKN